MAAARAAPSRILHPVRSGRLPVPYVGAASPRFGVRRKTPPGRPPRPRSTGAARAGPSPIPSAMASTLVRAARQGPAPRIHAAVP